MAPIAEGSIDDGQRSHISFRVEAARLVVVPEEHQTEVQHSMQERILESSRFPEISFTSETIQPIGENAWNVSANLQLHGQTRVNPSIRPQSGRKIHRLHNDQTDRLWHSTDQCPRRCSEGQERTEDRFRDRDQIESSDALLAHGDEPNPLHAHEETYQGMRLRLPRSSEPSE
jgi:hypothetical protein